MSNLIDFQQEAIAAKFIPILKEIVRQEEKSAVGERSRGHMVQEAFSKEFNTSQLIHLNWSLI